MNNSRIILIVLLIASLLGMVVSGEELFARLTYLWLFVLLGNWIWSVLSLRGLKFVRETRIKRAHMGQIFEERFEIQNPGRMPRLWLEVQDKSSLPGSRGSHVVTLVSGRQRRSYLARSRLLRRGVFHLGPTLIRSGDPFGLFPVQKEIPYQDSVVVYPMMYDLQEFPAPPGMLTGGEALRRRTHYVTPNAAGVREYAPGDSLSRIHWPSTARRDKLMVKEFELDPLSDIWIFLDAEEYVHAARPFTSFDLSKNVFMRNREEKILIPPSTEEYAASIAASLTRHFLRKRRAVGLVMSGQTSAILPPDRGARQLGKALESLALLRCVGTLPISGLIEAQAQHLARGSTVILVTPTTNQQFVANVDYLTRRGLRPVVVLLNAETFGGRSGSGLLAETLKTMDIPVRLVSNGDALETALVLPS